MEREQKAGIDVSLPYALSVITGFLILLGGIGTFAMLGWYPLMPAGQMWGGMMGGNWQMFTWPYPSWALGIMSAISLAAGAAVLVGAYKMKAEPEKVRKWGFLVLIASIVAFVCIGGFGLGAVLGIIGGAIAITKK